MSIVRTRALDLDSFARAVGLHPDLVRRFVALGLLDGETDSSGHLSFSSNEVATAFRLQRLRAGLGLNYAALGLVIELLNRITVMERALRLYARESGEGPWTPVD